MCNVAKKNPLFIVELSLLACLVWSLIDFVNEVKLENLIKLEKKKFLL